MTRPIRTKTMSRRDVLFSLFGRWRRSDAPSRGVGFDVQSREIETKLAEEDFQAAAELLEELLAKSPDHIQAMQKLAYCRYKLGLPEEGLELLNTVQSLKPTDNFTALYLGLILCRLERLDEAMNAWRDYFNIDQPVIQRAINLQLTLFEMDGPSAAQEVAQAVEEAISEQERLDRQSAWG